MPGDAVRRLAQPESRLRSEGRRGKGLGKGRGGGGEPGREKPAIKQLSLQGFVAVGAEPLRRAARGRPAPNFAPIPGSPRQPPPSAGPAPLNPLRAAAAAAERSVRRERGARPAAPAALRTRCSRRSRPRHPRCPPRRAREHSPPRTPVSPAAAETSDLAAPPHPTARPGQSTALPAPGESPGRGNPPRRQRGRDGGGVLICRLGCKWCQKEAGLN